MEKTRSLHRTALRVLPALLLPQSLLGVAVTTEIGGTLPSASLGESAGATASPSATATPTPTADQTAPEITDVSDAPDPFVPNAPGRKGRARISFSLSEPARVSASIRTRGGRLVATLLRDSLRAEGRSAVMWHGRNERGREVKPGRYVYRISAEDEAGNRSETVTGSTTVKRNVYAATVAGNFRGSVSDIPRRVYVPNTLSDSVSVIDPRTSRVVRSLRVGDLPHHVTPSRNLRRLYVNNTSGNSLTALDPATGRATGTIGVLDPYNLYFTPDGRKAIVVAERYQRLDFRDPKSWKLLKSVSIPWRGVDHLDFNAGGRFLLASTEFSGYVVKVDARKMRRAGRLYVGGLPIDVRLSPDGSVFYVANQGRHGVSVVDPNPLREVKFIPTGRGAHGLAVSRDTRLLYVSNRLEGSISVISFRRRAVVAKWRVGGSPDMLQVSPDGEELWVSNRYGDTVSVISTAGGKVLRSIRVGRGPHGIAFFPQPGRYSLGHNGVYR